MSNNTTGMYFLHIRIDRERKRKLKMKVLKEDTNISAVLIKMIDDYLKG